MGIQASPQSSAPMLEASRPTAGESGAQVGSERGGKGARGGDGSKAPLVCGSCPAPHLAGPLTIWRARCGLSDRPFMLTLLMVLMVATSGGVEASPIHILADVDADDGLSNSSNLSIKLAPSSALAAVAHSTVLVGAVVITMLMMCCVAMCCISALRGLIAWFKAQALLVGHWPSTKSSQCITGAHAELPSIRSGAQEQAEPKRAACVRTNRRGLACLFLATLVLVLLWDMSNLVHGLQAHPSQLYIGPSHDPHSHVVVSVQALLGIGSRLHSVKLDMLECHVKATRGPNLLTVTLQAPIVVGHGHSQAVNLTMNVLDLTSSFNNSDDIWAMTKEFNALLGEILFSNTSSVVQDVSCAAEGSANLLGIAPVTVGAVLSLGADGVTNTHFSLGKRHLLTMRATIPSGSHQIFGEFRPKDTVIETVRREHNHWQLISKELPFGDEWPLRLAPLARSELALDLAEFDMEKYVGEIAFYSTLDFELKPAIAASLRASMPSLQSFIMDRHLLRFQSSKTTRAFTRTFETTTQVRSIYDVDFLKADQRLQITVSTTTKSASGVRSNGRLLTHLPPVPEIEPYRIVFSSVEQWAYKPPFEVELDVSVTMGSGTSQVYPIVVDAFSRVSNVSISLDFRFDGYRATGSDPMSLDMHLTPEGVHGFEQLNLSTTASYCVDTCLLESFDTKCTLLIRTRARRGPKLFLLHGSPTTCLYSSACCAVATPLSRDYITQTLRYGRPTITIRTRLAMTTWGSKQVATTALAMMVVSAKSRLGLCTSAGRSKLPLQRRKQRRATTPISWVPIANQDPTARTAHQANPPQRYLTSGSGGETLFWSLISSSTPAQTTVAAFLRSTYRCACCQQTGSTAG